MSHEIEASHIQEVQKLAVVLQKVAEVKEKEGQTDYHFDRLVRTKQLQRIHGEHLTKEGVSLLSHCEKADYGTLYGLGVRNIKEKVELRILEKLSIEKPQARR